VIAVGEYDPVDSMKKHIDEYKLTFPVVWESDARTRSKRRHTTKFGNRSATHATGDRRGTYFWKAVSSSRRSVIAKKAPIVNGELIQPDVEKFIREKVGRVLRRAE
jgi:hypothetical protein